MMTQKEILLKTAVERLTTLVTLAQGGATAIYINTQSSASPIKDALDAITDNDETHRYSIFCAPGIYTEDNPIQGKSYVTVEAEGMHTVRVVAANADQDLFLGVNLFYLIGFSFVGVVGATNYAVNHSAPGEMVVKNCVATDCSNGVLVNHASALMNILDFALYTPTILNMQKGINVLAGNVTISFLKVVATSTLDIVLNVDGTDATALPDTIQSASPNVNIGINVDNDGSISGFGIKLVRLVDGLVISGTSSSVKLNTLQILAAQNDGIRVENVGTDIDVVLLDTTASLSTGLNYNVLNPNCVITATGLTEIANSFVVDGAGFYAHFLDTTEGDESLNILGELRVGRPQLPSESAFGEGDSHVNMKVFTFDGVSTYVDVTTSAASASASTFTFPGLTAGNSILIYNLAVKAGSPLTFPGVKTLIETAVILGAGSVVAEYWNGAWIPFNIMETESFNGYLSHGSKLFQAIGTFQTYFNPEISKTPLDWIVSDPAGYGTNHYVIKFSIASTITTAPVFQQLKVRTNSVEINESKSIQKYGNFRDSVKKSINIETSSLSGFAPSSSTISYGVGIDAVTLLNTFGNNDRSGLVIEGQIEEGVDTSGPLQLIVRWYGTSAVAGDVELEIDEVDVSVGDTLDGTAVPQSSSQLLPVGTNEEFILKETIFEFDVNTLEQGENFVISLFRDGRPGNDPPDTYGGDVVIQSIELKGNLWKI